MSDENIVNAEPVGGWKSAEVQDHLSSSDAAQQLQEEAPDIEVSERGEPDPVSAHAGADADPDLLTDDQVDSER